MHACFLKTFENVQISLLLVLFSFLLCRSDAIRDRLPTNNEDKAQYLPDDVHLQADDESTKSLAEDIQLQNCQIKLVRDKALEAVVTAQKSRIPRNHGLGGPLTIRKYIRMYIRG